MDIAQLPPVLAISNSEGKACNPSQFMELFSQVLPAMTLSSSLRPPTTSNLPASPASNATLADVSFKFPHPSSNASYDGRSPVYYLGF